LSVSILPLLISNYAVGYRFKSKAEKPRIVSQEKVKGDKGTKDVSTCTEKGIDVISDAALKLRCVASKMVCKTFIVMQHLGPNCVLPSELVKL